MAARARRRGRDELRHRVAHARMIETEAGCRLRSDARARVGDEARVRVGAADPFGLRVRVELDDDAKSSLVCQREQLIERLEVILAAPRLRCRPIDPALDAVETEALDLLEIAPPRVAFRRRISYQHRRSRGAA